MRITERIALAAMGFAALGACSQDNAPSDKIKDAADSVVKTVDGTAPVKLAQGKYAPRDECADTPGAEDFRKQLLEAVKAKDADRLAALAAPDVKLDFGGGSGATTLVSRLSKGEQDLWGELAQMMALGCGVNEQGGITIPWYASTPLDGIDTTFAMLVAGEAVPVHRDADAKSPAVENVSWDFVRLSGGYQPDDAFQKVETADGTSGFVASDKLRSPLDYRLIASSRDGKWSFTSLVSGD